MTTQQPPIATWFRDARLGIFIHYGIYAVKGVAESWSFFHGRIDKADYDAQIEGFSAANFDADQWAQLFRDAGADYAVLTTKHHDGWALWPTKVGKSTVERTGRDIVGEFVDACRRHGLRVGLYYSHLDWSHPDYASIRPVGMDPAERGNPYSHPAHDAQDPEAWQRFLQFHRAQLTELLTAYHPDLLWFDGDWERDPDQWHMGELREWLRTVSPDLVCNGRMTGGYGDYATPEQGVPVNPPQGPWELCLTMNDNWGFHHHDLNYKSTHRIARVLADTISAGGRLLLDVGPRADGTIPTEAVDRLQELGQWTAAVRPAIDAERGLPHGYFAGPTTLSSDRTRLYLFVFDPPRVELVLRGLGVGITSARVLGSDTPVGHERVGGHLDNAGWDYFTLPPEAIHPLCTVVEVCLDDPLQLRGEHTRD